MANLHLQNGNFNLSPISINGNRLLTQISLKITILGDEITISNDEKIYVLNDDFDRLISNIWNFLYSRRDVKNDIRLDSDPTIEFVPLDLLFIFSCLDGDVNEDFSEGELTVQVMLNLEILDKTMSSEYIGGIFNVDVKNLVQFVRKLQDEITNLV